MQIVDEYEPIMHSPASLASSSVFLPSSSPGPSSPTSPRSFSSISTTPSRTNKKICLPKFWREETQACLDEGILNEVARGDITRTLVTLLTAKYGPRPGRGHCEDVARHLILKYPFAKEWICM